MEIESSLMEPTIQKGKSTDDFLDELKSDLSESSKTREESKNLAEELADIRMQSLRKRAQSSYWVQFSDIASEVKALSTLGKELDAQFKRKTTLDRFLEKVKGPAAIRNLSDVLADYCMLANRMTANANTLKDQIYQDISKVEGKYQNKIREEDGLARKVLFYESKLEEIKCKYKELHEIIVNNHITKGSERYIDCMISQMKLESQLNEYETEAHKSATALKRKNSQLRRLNAAVSLFRDNYLAANMVLESVNDITEDIDTLRDLYSGTAILGKELSQIISMSNTVCKKITALDRNVFNASEKMANSAARALSTNEYLGSQGIVSQATATIGRHYESLGSALNDAHNIINSVD